MPRTHIEHAALMTVLANEAANHKRKDDYDATIGTIAAEVDPKDLRLVERYARRLAKACKARRRFREGGDDG